MSNYIEPKQEIKVAVDAICICEVNSEKYILFIKRQYEPFKDSLALPGGFLLSDEELETGVVRELREETNLKAEVQNIKQIGAFGKIGRDPRRRIISIAFSVDLGTKVALPEISTANETLEVHWVKTTDVSNYTLAFDHQEILAKSNIL